MDRRPTDAIALLTAEHQQILYLFRAYQDASTPHRKRTIAAQIFPALELHAQREETVFYPAFAQRADAAASRPACGGACGRGRTATGSTAASRLSTSSRARRRGPAVSARR